MKEPIITGLAAIIFLGVVAQWLAWRLRLPSIVLLLAFGIIAGPITGFFAPEAVFGELLYPVVSLSVAIILFEGGLSLRLASLREVGGVVRNLLTVGASVTWLGCTVAAVLILQFDWPLGLVLGAILVVSGPTVITPMLRHVRPVRRLDSIVRWEGILIDPIGAILAVLVFRAIVAGGSGSGIAGGVAGFFSSITIGAVVGLLGAALMVAALRKYLVPDFLHNSVMIMLVVGAYAIANLWQGGSGLLAVTVMGIALANQMFSPVKQIIEFKENLRELMIPVVFILLSASLKRADFDQIGAPAVVFLAALVLVVRPAAVLLSTLRSGLNKNEKLFLAAMAPRGIVAAGVSSVFAVQLVGTGYPGAGKLVPITFLVIIGTAAIYGVGARPLARRLQLADANPQGVLILGAHRWARAIAEAVKAQNVRVVLVDSNWENVSAARMENFEARYGRILSPSILDQIELFGIGRLLALTSNDEANSLATLHFRDLFGRAEVYQLSPANPKEGYRKNISPGHLSGRILFDHSITYDFLSASFHSGASVKTTMLTEKFGYGELQERYVDAVVPLFLVTPGRGFKVFTVEDSPTPRSGDTLISLAPPSRSYTADGAQGELAASHRITR